ncbi:hypothetical protein ISN45_Aa08g015800 [Arabidopsis thaliana x Arabidopsis arenosa]|uniref:KIB1-4 beta-propeller domain-containing protein n=1 Tax=Arabidopsis thaliana x Arabidopsis arenosa TaxID=1240361 RepID=A0A8T1XHH4_9BRAS|nr:hypothetical protein ISN45_Aa08g015800 [Arabidopsis thaliana x Arabidopsis arenosa]
MALLLSRLSRLRLGKPVFVRSSLLHSNGFSTSLLQIPPYHVFSADPCGPRYPGLGKLVIFKANEYDSTHLEKKVPMELVDGKAMVTIGSSHGWVATLKDDGVVRLQDDLNPVASDTHPKRIPLPPLVTLPHCQTQVVTNVAMSSSSPEDEDCLVAVKFLGPQLSLCRPAHSNSEWINIRIENPCFHSSPVMFSKKDGMFHIPGSGGHLIGSWDLYKHKNKPKIQRLRFKILPELTKTKRELLHSCCTSEHLVESRTTDETFLVKWYRKATSSGVVKMKTKALMVFKLDEEGNAVYTQDIGDLCIFLSKSEPFCVTASFFPGMCSNQVHTLDVDEDALVDLSDSSIISGICTFGAPYYIPPQKVDS